MISGTQLSLKSNAHVEFDSNQFSGLSHGGTRLSRRITTAAKVIQQCVRRRQRNMARRLGRRTKNSHPALETTTTQSPSSSAIAASPHTGTTLPPATEQRSGQARAGRDGEGTSDETVPCADATAPFPFPSPATEGNKDPNDAEEAGSRCSSRSTDAPSTRGSDRDADVACDQTSDDRVGIVGLAVAVGGGRDTLR